MMSHPSPQHLQVQVSHRQSPVSQHPQQSHLPQPALLTPIAAGTKGTRERAAQRIRLFIGSLHIDKEVNHLHRTATRGTDARRHHHRCQPPRRTPRHGRCGKDQEDAGSQVFERAGESEHVAKEEEVGHGEPDDEAP